MLSESARIASLDGAGLAALVAGLRRQVETWAGTLARMTKPSPAFADIVPLHLRA
ncbi:hypothetical protein D3C78_1892160 [compost metagenome]